MASSARSEARVAAARLNRRSRYEQGQRLAELTERLTRYEQAGERLQPRI
jgi:hypothetical protein